VPVKNHEGGEFIPAAEQIGTEFLHLVRLGLRGADDPLIRDSTIVADAILRTDTPAGPVWHRYNDDGYGEHDDGRPFDGSGRGRGWPLLTGERGHYELMAGKDPLPYLRAMAAMASPCGMLPEQVWDSDPIEQYRLTPGRPTGSAMPLAWAHAEFIKLIVSRHIGHPFDRPRAVWERYQGKRLLCSHAFWWPHAPISEFGAGAKLVIALPRPSIVHWGTNGWQKPADEATIDTGMEFHAACLEVDLLKPGESVDFTCKCQESGEWDGRDYRVTAHAR
jgi:glucoamylase